MVSGKYFIVTVYQVFISCKEVFISFNFKILVTTQYFLVDFLTIQLYVVFIGCLRVVISFIEKCISFYLVCISFFILVFISFLQILLISCLYFFVLYRNCRFPMRKVVSHDKCWFSYDKNGSFLSKMKFIAYIYCLALIILFKWLKYKCRCSTTYLSFDII